VKVNAEKRDRDDELNFGSTEKTVCGGIDQIRHFQSRIGSCGASMRLHHLYGLYLSKKLAFKRSDMERGSEMNG
jgi:hypothetical protein